MSNRVGKEFRRDCTSFLIPGIEFTVLRGLSILITLMPETLVLPKNLLTHPTITTTKSSWKVRIILLLYSKGLSNMSKASAKIPLQIFLAPFLLWILWEKHSQQSPNIEEGPLSGHQLPRKRSLSLLREE